MSLRIPFHRADLHESDIDAVTTVLRTGWLTSGAVATRFESAIATYVGAPYALATNSCTAALHLALRAVGVSAGDEVIVPTWTFCATANVVEHLGGTVRLVDVDSNLNITRDAIEGALSPKTKAVLPVHFAGRAYDVTGVRALAQRAGISVIEDGAHALGTRTMEATKVGAAPSTTAFSFYATKPITTGEGGMLVSDDSDFVDRCRRLALHGMSTHAWSRYQPGGQRDYDVAEPGYKYNLSDIQAALGIGQVDRIDHARGERADIAAEYARRLGGLSPALELPIGNGGHAWHLFVVRVDPEYVNGGRNAVATELERHGIGTSIHFRPVHTFSYYRKKYGHREGQFPIAEQAFAQVLSLPIYPGLSTEDVAEVSRVIEEAVGVLAR